MSLFARFNLPETSEATAVQKFYQAHIDMDFSNASDFFTEDVALNGLMLQMKGIDEISSSSVEFLTKFPIEIKIEGVSMLDKHKRCMVLLSIKQKEDKPIMECDLFHFKDGKICLIENCFDIDTVPKEMKDEFEKMQA